MGRVRGHSKAKSHTRVEIRRRRSALRNIEQLMEQKNISSASSSDAEIDVFQSRSLAITKNLGAENNEQKVKSLTNELTNEFIT